MKPGYKETSVGVIPEDWEVKTIKNIGQITSSKRIHQSDYTNSGVPFYRGKEITLLSKGRKPKELVYIKEETFNLLSKRFGSPKNGDILITAVGTIGSIYLVEENNKFYFKDGNLIWLRNISQDINKRYLSTFLKSDYSQKIISELSSGSSQKALTIIKIKDLPIIIPKWPEQEKIASVLTTVDDKIESITKQIETTIELKKGLMQKLFSEGIGHTEFKDSPVGKIPSKWESVRVQDVLKIKYGKDQKKIIKKNGKYPILGTGGCIGQTDSFLFDRPSVLIGRKGTIDKPKYMETPFWTVDTLFYTDVFEVIIPKVVFYIFQTIDWYKYNEATGVPSLSATNIYAINIPLPPLKEQQQIADILSCVDDKIEVLRSKKESYLELKKGLMQKLLTGEIRVKVNG